MKKTALTIASSLIISGSFMFSPTQSNAEELTDSNSSGVIDLNNLEKLEESGDVKVTINKLTYDEFIENRAKAKGITIEQAKEIYKNPNIL